MKKKRNVIIIVVVSILVIITSISLYVVLNDKNKLTVVERNWINDNISSVQNINIVNNANVFGKYGSGVFYEFLEDFKEEYSLTINPITYNIGSNPSGISFGVKRKIDKNDIVFYQDHFVLVGKNKEIIEDEERLNEKTVGVLSSDLSYISNYIKKANNISYIQYETKEELLENMGNKVNYMIVPLMEYLDILLTKELQVVYHFSDIKVNYVMQTTNDTLSSVLRKYYDKWSSNFNEVFNDSLFLNFTTNMNISETDIDAMQSVVYNYGFVNASPYEIIMGGKYGGIVAVYLSKFSDFADVEFNFVKYRNFKEFSKSLNKKDIDLYFNYYNINDDYKQTSGLNIEYVIVAPRTNNTVVNSLQSLVGSTLYVQENSKIYDYVASVEGINVHTFSTPKELFKLNKKDVYIALDRKTFDYYQDSKLNNYTMRYSDYLQSEYTFKVKNDGPLNKLLDRYVSVMDEEQMIIEGLNNHYETVKSGGVITKIAEYILLLVVIIAVIILIILKKSKKISIARKIKKDDKMKFIDQLTSLKNRNFLNENISTWNNNTIYPQTIIVIDLNKIQEINDLYGYNEGDKQIKAMANILIKTQLDNSEVMRSDGNEFLVYLVGYTQKQIGNYIHKLNREIKKLPYEFGAEFGYSMIQDDIKTIEDALNEAVEDMKKQKEIKAHEESKA